MLNKIFVCIPGGTVTGGTETLHQLAGALTKYHDETYVVYLGGGGKRDYKIPDKFIKYNVKVAKNVEDIDDNLVIVSETFLGVLKNYSVVKRCVFWLSLDYYIRQQKPRQFVVNMKHWFSGKQYFHLFVRCFCGYLVRKIFGKLLTIKNLTENTFHLYNCEYVKEYLLSKGVAEKNTMYLCGPLEKLYFEPLDKESVLKNKENIIAYNPARGDKYITQLQKVNTNNYQFVPIKNMTSQQVKELLLRAKLYVDFGYFPGPERIPRQAAMCYCSILTSNSGSAANDFDVPIPKENKVDVKHFNQKEAYKKVVSLLDSFEYDVSKYDIYREKVLRQDLDFEETIERFLQRYFV